MFDEIEFRKKIHKRNTLRTILKEKKALASKMAGIPECTDEYLKLNRDIQELEARIKE